MGLAVDCVIIGINSASTLADCIEHVQASHYDKGELRIIYVDSGSTDDSISIAQSLDAKVVKLHPRHPTPGMGRNAGWRVGKAPFVQFIDSDTLVHPEWIHRGVSALQEKQHLGAVRGRLDEVSPDASIFNWIGHQEWNPKEAGVVDCLGGNALIRREVLEQTQGFDEHLVVGEDPEFSQRVCARGWQIEHLNCKMASHDLAMFDFKHYLKRSFRTGYGFAVVSHMHKESKNAFWRKELQRILLRGGGAAGLIVCSLLGLYWHSAFLFLLFPALALIFYPRLFSVARLMSSKQLSYEEACRYAWHCSVVVVPQFLGVLRFFGGRLLGLPLRNR